MGIDKYTGKREQVGWSVSTIQTFHVEQLVIRATTAYLSGKLDKLFWLLLAIRENIIFELTPDEITTLDNQEKTIARKAKVWHAIQKDIEDEVADDSKVFNARYEYSNEIRVFWREIMKDLKRTGHYTVRKDTTRMGF